MAWKLSIFRIDSPKYAVPLTFQAVYSQLALGGAITGSIVGTIWYVFISERIPSSAFWVSLVGVLADIVGALTIGLLYSMFITFFLWHLLWIAALLRIFLPIKWITGSIAIVLMTINGYFFLVSPRTSAEIIMCIGASLLLTAIAIWRVHILEQTLYQKPKNEEVAKVKK